MPVRRGSRRLSDLAPRLIDALCVAVLQDRATWHGEAFHCARAKPAAVDATLDRIRTRTQETGEPLQDRPACERSVHPQTPAEYDESVQEAFTAVDGEPLGSVH
ncbi:hypothetical protein [Streptomyces erythrochromogenes]|uniref:hypothetical protein n=1 Tax=Streptomyces erythrochromogenes TaxID=285574 RepID=UPI0036F9C4D4